ncbi:sigma-70 family RNA polymerase sigma factor [bacterium]|nr:sigma-70 family RNA polymerase sigma factor [candidate division CSSED10-310 bacterium]
MHITLQLSISFLSDAWSSLKKSLEKTYADSKRLPLKRTFSGIKEPDQNNDFERMSDEMLIQAYAKYQRLEAFNILFTRYRTELYGFLVNWSGNKSHAEDLFQEIFLRVIRSAKTFQPKAKFRTWLYTIARNLLIDTSRKKKIREPVTVHEKWDFDNSSSFEAVSRSDLNPLDQLTQHELKSIIRKALLEMPEEQRELFFLREYAGIDFKEAAKISGCTVNTAKSRMRYALLKLRDAILKWSNDSPKEISHEL